MAAGALKAPTTRPSRAVPVGLFALLVLFLVPIAVADIYLRPAAHLQAQAFTVGCHTADLSV
jgi:hypothetical protein